MRTHFPAHAFSPHTSIALGRFFTANRSREARVSRQDGVAMRNSFRVFLGMALGLAIGISTVTINYSRPLAGTRELWGKVVPYGKVWRAGANENTTITFSDDATVEGKPLSAGTYGLHMI